MRTVLTQRLKSFAFMGGFPFGHALRRTQPLALARTSSSSMISNGEDDSVCKGLKFKAGTLISVALVNGDATFVERGSSSFISRESTPTAGASGGGVIARVMVT
jgi:hypothetical protein